MVSGGPGRGAGRKSRLNDIEKRWCGAKYESLEIYFAKRKERAYWAQFEGLDEMREKQRTLAAWPLAQRAALLEAAERGDSAGQILIDVRLEIEEIGKIGLRSRKGRPGPLGESEKLRYHRIPRLYSEHRKIAEIIAWCASKRFGRRIIAKEIEANQEWYRAAKRGDLPGLF